MKQSPAAVEIASLKLAMTACGPRRCGGGATTAPILHHSRGWGGLGRAFSRRRKRGTSVVDRRWAESPPPGTTHQSPLTAEYPSTSLRTGEHDYECEYEGIIGAASAYHVTDVDQRPLRARSQEFPSVTSPPPDSLSSVGEEVAQSFSTASGRAGSGRAFALLMQPPSACDAIARPSGLG
jgi:hypothetical protein